MNSPDPTKDGIDHLNVYSKAKTELGRWMSNFAYEPIVLPGDGAFASIEGYWYWLTRQDDRLRILHGWPAKKLGRSFPKVKTYPDGFFQHAIRTAIMAKAAKRPDMIAKLQATTLPLEHYYVYGTAVRDAGYKWILYAWNDIRQGWHDDQGVVTYG